MPTSYLKQTQPLSLLRLFNDNHQQSESILQRLERLVANLSKPGSCADIRLSDLHMVADFFNNRISDNHLDEEVYMYQVLLNGSDKKLAKMARQVLAEHVWIENYWHTLSPLLNAAVQHTDTSSIQKIEAATDFFVRLQCKHMQQEKDVVFPAAKKLIDKDVAGRIAQVLQQRHNTYAQADKLAVASTA